MNFSTFSTVKLGTVQEPPNRTTCLKSTGRTPPICTAVHPSFVTLCLAGFSALEGNAAAHLQFVLQYASYLYHNTPPVCTGDTFEKISGAGCSGKFLISVVLPHLPSEIFRTSFSRFLSLPSLGQFGQLSPDWSQV